MRELANKLFQTYYHLRFDRIERMAENPLEAQQRTWEELMAAGRETEWGKRFGFQAVNSPSAYRRMVPIQEYEEFKSSIERMMLGESDILWPGKVTMFSKSSGTTSAKSKFIPVSNINFKTCHIRGTWDTMNILYHYKPDSNIFAGKNFLMIGNYKYYDRNQEVMYGDVSALMTRFMPKVARPFFEPDFDIIFRDDWESKIKLMAEYAIRDDVRPYIRMCGGVPTWLIVFFRHILEYSGKNNILEVWPNFEAYIHGGVSITPHMDQLRQLLPSDDITYLEVYNASEGYFGTQYTLDSKDLLLLVDNGVYYEFVPAKDWGTSRAEAIPLEGVKVGEQYVMIITTNAGLWRYAIGDTITFTNTQPYLYKITGRTTQFVNAFGEEIIVANSDAALANTCQETGAIAAEYTVAPIFFKGQAKGRHQWLIEFEKDPPNLARFTQRLDENLQAVNSDYEAKRYKDMALEQLELRCLPRGTFHNWLRSKGKFGNQHKVPRLSNDRKHVEEILAIVGI